MIFISVALLLSFWFFSGKVSLFLLASLILWKAREALTLQCKDPFADWEQSASR